MTIRAQNGMHKPKILPSLITVITGIPHYAPNTPIPALTYTPSSASIHNTSFHIQLSPMPTSIMVANSHSYWH